MKFIVFINFLNESFMIGMEINTDIARNKHFLSSSCNAIL